MTGERLCYRSDHPERRHWHYGYGAQWCTDPNSALLYQDGASRGPAYIKPQAEPAPDLVPARVLNLPLLPDRVLHVTPHLPGDRLLTFDLVTGDNRAAKSSNMTAESARVLRDYLTEWLDGGAR